MDTDNSVFCKQFWIFGNFNMSCRTRKYRHEPCQMPENGCLASSHNQFLFLFLVYLNSNEGVYKGVNLYCHPFFLWPLLETGLEEKSELKFKFSILAYPSGQILWYLERTTSFEWLEIKIDWGIKWQTSCHNSFLLFSLFAQKYPVEWWKNCKARFLWFGATGWGCKSWTSLSACFRN